MAVPEKEEGRIEVPPDRSETPVEVLVKERYPATWEAAQKLPAAQRDRAIGAGSPVAALARSQESAERIGSSAARRTQIAVKTHLTGQTANAEGQAMRDADTVTKVPVGEKRSLEGFESAVKGRREEAPQQRMQVVSSPGGWVPSTNEQQRIREHAPPPQPALEAWLQAQALQNEADLEKGYGAAGYAQQAGKIQGQQAKMTQDFAAAKQKRDEQVQRVVGRMREGMQKMEADIAAGKNKPIDHWAHGSLLGAIVGGFVGIGAGLTGQENAFHKAVWRTIDQRYKAQQDDLARKERGVGRARTELDALMQLHGDADAAQLGFYNLHLSALETRLNQLATEHEGTMAGTKFKEALANLMAMRAGKFQEWADYIQGKTVEKADNKFLLPKTTVVGGAGKKDLSPDQDLIRNGLDRADVKILEQQTEIEYKLGLPQKRASMRMLMRAVQAADAELGDQLAGYIRTGDAGAATQLVASIAESNPQKWALVRRSMVGELRAASGLATTDAERADIRSQMKLFSTNDKGIVPYVQAQSFELNQLENQASRTFPGAYIFMQKNLGLAERLRPQQGIPMSQGAVSGEGTSKIDAVDPIAGGTAETVGSLFFGGPAAALLVGSGALKKPKSQPAKEKE